MLHHLYILVAGIVFGLANVIPGVSGGTMAVVFGIYERLLSVLSDPLHNIKKEWKFLVTFAMGICLSLEQNKADIPTIRAVRVSHGRSGGGADCRSHAHSHPCAHADSGSAQRDHPLTGRNRHRKRPAQVRL